MHRLVAQIVLELCVVALAQEVQEAEDHFDVRVSRVLSLAGRLHQFRNNSGEKLWISESNTEGEEASRATSTYEFRVFSPSRAACNCGEYLR